MERFPVAASREYFITHAAGTALSALAFDGEPFPCLIWSAARVDPNARMNLVTGLLASGCRYFVCGGDSPEQWEDDADEAVVARPKEEEGDHVMTTAHRGESMDDVAFFFVKCTDFEAHSFRRALVVLVGGDAAVRGALIRAVEHAAQT